MQGYSTKPCPECGGPMKFFSGPRCITCQRAADTIKNADYRRRQREKKLAAGWVPRRWPWTAWSAEELLRLEEAAEAGLTCTGAAFYVGTYRTPSACKAMAQNYAFRGLYDDLRERKPSRPLSARRKWTPERLERLYRAVFLYGPREGARRAGEGECAALGALHRYPMPRHFRISEAEKAG